MGIMEKVPVKFFTRNFFLSSSGYLQPPQGTYLIRLNFDGKLDSYVKRYIFVTVHWQYPAKRVAVNSNIFSYRHDIV